VNDDLIELIAAIVFVALIIVAGLAVSANYMTDKQAIFLGPFLGGVVGLLALMVAALVNASLQRAENKRVRRENQYHSVLAAYVALEPALVQQLRVLAGLHRTAERGSIEDENVKWLCKSAYDNVCGVHGVLIERIRDASHSSLGAVQKFEKSLMTISVLKGSIEDVQFGSVSYGVSTWWVFERQARECLRSIVEIGRASCRERV